MILCLVLAFSTAILSSQETRNLADFDEVHASAGVKVILTASDVTKAVVEVENCESSEVITKIEGNELIVKFKSNRGHWKRSKGRKATITVHYRSLNELRVSAGAYMRSANPIRTPEMNLNGASGGQMMVEVEAESIEVDVASGGIVEIEGSCKDLEFDVSSGGVFRGYELQAQIVDGEASSGGMARVYVMEDFDARASSGGSIAYKGNPSRTDIDAGFSGSIRSKN